MTKHHTRLSSLARLSSKIVALSGAVSIGASAAWAASHVDAPLIKQDPTANITDVYTFVGEKHGDPGTKVLNVLVTVHPFIDPGDGVTYSRFADDARYSIHLAHPVSGETITRYDFEFSDVNPKSEPGLKNPDTILSYGRGTEVGAITEVSDARQNYTQFYSVMRNNVPMGTDHLTAPPNVGPNTTPAYNGEDGKAMSGAETSAELDDYTQQTIYEMSSGVVVFAGHRDDGFFADTPALFDLVDSRVLDNDGDLSDGLGQDGGGIDGFKGYNVLTYAVQIPVDQLSTNSYMDPFFGEANGVGVYASVSRRRITLRGERGENRNVGRWVQVNRMGNPLFNELFVPNKDKDEWNRSKPENDAVNYAQYAEQPELAVLLNALYSTGLQTTGRADLRAVFIPDVIRVNTDTAPVPVPGQEGFSRIGFIGGDTTDGVSSGWPNGRRIGDDVVDIGLTAIASGPAYTEITLVGDNVHTNDQEYNEVFPYLATPHSGPNVDQRQAPAPDMPEMSE